LRKYLLYFFLFILASLVSFILLFSPSHFEFNTVVVPGKFSITVPEYLFRSQGIDSQAVLQYKNEKENILLLVYEKMGAPNQELTTFFKNTASGLVEKTDHGSLMKYYPDKIDSHYAMVGHIRGRVHETDVFYKIAIIRSGKFFYEILIGTTGNTKSIYAEDMEKIISGFKPNS
jgi:hypothetical protein